LFEGPRVTTRETLFAASLAAAFFATGLAAAFAFGALASKRGDIFPMPLKALNQTSLGSFDDSNLGFCQTPTTKIKSYLAHDSGLKSKSVFYQ
jgi:hypothetical protein